MSNARPLLTLGATLAGALTLTLVGAVTADASVVPEGARPPVASLVDSSGEDSGCLVTVHAYVRAAPHRGTVVAGRNEIRCSRPFAFFRGTDYADVLHPDGSRTPFPYGGSGDIKVPEGTLSSGGGSKTWDACLPFGEWRPEPGGTYQVVIGVTATVREQLHVAAPGFRAKAERVVTVTC